MYCNQCKKMLDSKKFELKKDNISYYTRCITCRNKFNKYQKNKYNKTCSRQTLCNKEDCNNCYNKSFASYKGKTSNGKLKVDCWHEDNKLKPREVFKSCNKILVNIFTVRKDLFFGPTLYGPLYLFLFL